MDEAMAPPTKRRKLCSSGSESIHRDNSTPHDTLHSHSHATRGCTTPDSPHLQHSPTPTEELHQEVKRAAVAGIELAAALALPQGAGAVSSAAPSQLLSGSIQIFTDASTTLTYTPPALPLLPTLPSVPGATTFLSTTSVPSTLSSSSSSSHTSSSSNPTTISPANATSSATASSSLTTSAIILIGGNRTTTSKTTITVTRSSSSILYYATLGDGDVSTITRSNSAFTTTVEGEIFTIPGYFDSQSRLGSSTSTTEFDGEDVTSPTATANVPGAGGAQTHGTPANTGAPGPTSTVVNETNGEGGGNHSDAPPAGTIAGGVVGGAAGLAVIVLIAMLVVRWYRRKSQMRHQALPPGTASAFEEKSRSGPGMAERAGIAPFAAAVPAILRHQTRGTEPDQSERSFTRISGRKLPSQWSQGMNSNQPPSMPLSVTTSGEESERNLRRESYHGDGSGHGVDLSPGAASPGSIDKGPLRTSDPGTMMMSPGPERQPQVHYGGPYAVSRPGQAGTLSTSPPGAASGLGRSETPSSLFDHNRGSRFTEDM